MKNMKKFITLCGFLILGSIACGDADVVKAKAINNQTTDTSGYTITIPSDVDIDKNSGKGSFAITGKMDAQTELDVSVNSLNKCKLKNKNQEISYSLDKDSFHVDNIKSADMKSFDENFNITLANTNTSFSGSYEDKLVFDITGNRYTYVLDLNSILDGKVMYSEHTYGVVDIYINNKLVASNVSDWNKTYPYGTEYEIKNIRATDGHHYSGVGSIDNVPPIPLKGRIGIDTYCAPRTNAPHILCTPCYFKFDTNKLTLNYHADGAQTWNNFWNIIQDVSNKDIAYSETKKYGATFDSRAGLADVLRLTKLGYTATEHTWTIGKAGTKKVMDNVGLAKMEDVAEYCGVLDKFKKNDVTVDLYPIWEPLLNTITYDANGGTLSTTKTQQFYTGTPYKAPENSKSFSGTSTDDCEDLGYYNYAFGNKLTISTKIRFNSSDDTLPQKLQEFFCNYEWGGFGLGLGEDTRPYFSVFRENKDDYDILRSKTKIKPNETYWITGVYDGPNNTMSIYINGEKTNTIQLSATGNPNIKVSPLGLSLGGNPIVGDHYSNLTKGDIWKCGLWQNALSDEEVMKMYKIDTLAEGSFISRNYSAPKKTYYLFDGWYTQPTGGNKITTGTIINSSMTLYAHYKPILSFINYDSNEGTGIMQSETILSTDKTNLSKNIFTKDGYALKGWLASRKYKSNVEYLYVNPNGGGGWFEKGAQPSGWSKLYLLSDEEPIYLISAYDGLTLTFHAQWEKAYSAGTVLNIEGSNYIVMSQTDDDTYLVIDGESLGNIQYQPNVNSDGNYKVGTYETPDDKRPDGQYSNTYEGSYIDNYLENTWYKQLPDKLQKAIQVTDIKQASYMDFASNPKWKYFDPNGGSSNDWYYNEGTTENPKWVVYYKANFPEDAQGAHPLNCWKYSEKGYNNTTYNAISRHVFLPSVEEVSNLVDLNNANKVYDFLKGTNNSLYHMWFRDGYTGSPRSAMYLSYSFRSMNKDLITDAGIGARPAFVINLSKVNYTVTGSVNYK